ncbi:MAG: hypothetical protein JWO11_2601 [Nocardioides sp.]|nr:hypothetical protein [Nocardioides sp.]
MLRRLLILLFASALFVSVEAPAQAHPRGDIFDQGSFNSPYTFTDSSCGFDINVKGRARGHFVYYNVPGSDGQAFLNDSFNRFREVLTNPATGERLFNAGASRFTEVSAKHLYGNVWQFISVERIFYSVIRDSHGRVVLWEHGTIVRRQVFDTLGDSQPGGDVIRETIIRKRGHLPSFEPDFDFCALVTPLIG